MNHERAEQAYKAYGESANWGNHLGKKMPTWEELPEVIKQHWLAVATVLDSTHQSPVEGQHYALNMVVDSAMYDRFWKLTSELNISPEELLYLLYNQGIEVLEQAVKQDKL